MVYVPIWLSISYLFSEFLNCDIGHVKFIARCCIYASVNACHWARWWLRPYSFVSNYLNNADLILIGPIRTIFNKSRWSRILNVFFDKMILKSSFVTRTEIRPVQQMAQCSLIWQKPYMLSMSITSTRLYIYIRQFLIINLVELFLSVNTEWSNDIKRKMHIHRYFW